MHPMSTEDFLREIVFGNNGNASSSGTLLSGVSSFMPPQAAGWQDTAPRQSLLGSPQAGSSASAFRMRCTTNHLGKIEAKEEHTPNESTRWEYTYDVAGHLATVRCNGKVTEEYTYNAQGQRIADCVPRSLRHMGGQRRFAYNYEGQLVEVNSTRFYYTASGTLRGRQENGKNTYFSYGDDTRLDSVTLPSGFEVRYEYGQSLLPERIHVSGRLVGEYRWHSPLQLYEYYDVMQDTRYTFQYKGNRVPAGVHISGTGAAFIRERFQCGNLDYYSPMFQAQGATDSLFLHIGADQVGSIRTLSTEDGRMVKEITYDSFGNVLHDSFPELSFPLGFAGGLVDEHTGFVRFGYRDYDPQTGRFTAQDPARDLRGDADLYDYCVDDPVSCIDPQGLATQQWNENLHPRDDVGKFTFKDGSGGGQGSNKSTEADANSQSGKGIGNSVAQGGEDKGASSAPSQKGSTQRVGDKVKEVNGVEVKDEKDKYYVIGKRPLDSVAIGNWYGEGDNKFQHRQLIKNDGINFGLTGNNNGVTPFEDTKDQLKKYEYYDGNKYKAEFIEAAKDALEQEWQEELGRRKEHNQERSTPARTGAIFHGIDEGLQSEARYGITHYNCQDYVDDIVARAKRIAERRGEKLEVD
ncbi:RHS repeat domain-containing protein [Desulfovibrio cuneatus]|uniref:RHS repeat domain-containing protein n=1 Tax=Desulfovibrio cuneatus TaxID=159728 RepID=UPI0004239199|nr:RHS repeat-associated core domain-containing protein [Desulfovibrio cuneatus]